MLGTELLLSSRRGVTLEVEVIFWLFLTQYHANLRGWGYIFIADKVSQAYTKMLV
jgi:hypothetical protein